MGGGREPAGEMLSPTSRQVSKRLLGEQGFNDMPSIPDRCGLPRRTGYRVRMLMPSMRAPVSVRGRCVLPGANTT